MYVLSYRMYMTRKIRIRAPPSMDAMLLRHEVSKRAFYFEWVRSAMCRRVLWFVAALSEEW